MNKLKPFSLSFGTTILRFYLMMGVIIVAGFTGYWLLGLLALPIFLSVLLGIGFEPESKFKKELNASRHTLKNTRQGEFQEVA